MAIEIRPDRSGALSDRDIAWFNRPRPAARPGALTERDIRPKAPNRAFSPVPVADQASTWVRQSLQALVDLPIGWDSYGGHPVDIVLAQMIEPFVIELISNNVAAPSLVPTSVGGVALEWHRPSLDLTIEFEPLDMPAYSVGTVFFADAQSGEEWEASADGLDVARFNDALARLKQPETQPI